jgi:hypothetical protein
MKYDLPKRLQARVALLAIGRSTLRSQGAPGVIAAARRYLRDVDLGAFATIRSRAQFEKLLEEHTRSLMKRFPSGANKSWGGARKAMNIFLRDAVYNRVLCDHYRIVHLEPLLELPLDSNTYEGLVEDSAPDQVVPGWPRLKNLDPSLNSQLQAIAQAIAKRFEIHRVHLDIKYWRKLAIDSL